MGYHESMLLFGVKSPPWYFNGVFRVSDLLMHLGDDAPPPRVGFNESIAREVFFGPGLLESLLSRGYAVAE